MNIYSERHNWNEEAFLQHGFFLQWDNQRDLIAWGASSRAASPQVGEISCYIPDFYMEDDKPWCIFEHGGLFERSGSWSKPPVTPRTWQEPQQEDFSWVFNLVQDHIRADELNKAVGIVFAKSHGEISWAEKLRAFQQTPCLQGLQLYGWWQGGEGILGCTPELLFSYNPDRKHLRTMALAGTQKPKAPALLKDPKESFEHQLVVTAIHKSLSHLGFVHIKPTYEWDINLIQHLRTDMEVEVHKNINLNELCQFMHPTPALGISSSKLHWKWLKEIDPPVPRKRFGAPFGAILPNGHGKILVAIRNIQWFDGKSYLGSGCGIVKQSQLDHEWEELSIKRHSTKQSLGFI